MAKSLQERLDAMIDDERMAQEEYRKLTLDLLEHLKNVHGGCIPKDIEDNLMHVAEIANDETRHMLILEKMRCLI